MSTSKRRAGPRKKINSCVRPGVLDVRASALRPVSALIRLDFPTFERPAKAISTPCIGGSAANTPAAALKLQSDANSRRPASISPAVKAADIGRTTHRQNVLGMAPYSFGGLIFESNSLRVAVSPFSLFAEASPISGRFARRLLPNVLSRPGSEPSFENDAEMLSHSSTLTPLRRMMMLCWVTDSVLFQAQ